MTINFDKIGLAFAVVISHVYWLWLIGYLIYVQFFPHKDPDQNDNKTNMSFSQKSSLLKSSSYAYFLVLITIASVIYVVVLLRRLNKNLRIVANLKAATWKWGWSWNKSHSNIVLASFVAKYFGFVNLKFCVSIVLAMILSGFWFEAKSKNAGDSRRRGRQIKAKAQFNGDKKQ